MMTTKRLPPSLAVVAMTVTLLTGCGVPTSGPTTRVEKVPDDMIGSAELDDPLLPTSNAEETVTAFLGASAGDWSGRDDRLNEFVANGSGNWSEPEAGNVLVRLSEDAINVKDGANATSVQVEVDGKTVGTYLPDGKVDAATGNTDFHETFDLKRDEPSQSWRITNPPDQVLLLDTTFAERYATQSLYFPAKGDAVGTLVPDVRWIPRSLTNDQERYSQLTEWLLDGPSEWLSDSVDSAFPRNTARKAVTVTNSKVTVDVSSESASQEMGAPSDMSAQLAWSLGLSESQQLSLLVDGQERMSAAVSDWNNRNRAPADDTAARNLSYFLNNGSVQADRPEAAFVGGDSLGLQAASLEPHGDRLAGVVAGDAAQHLIVGPQDKLETVKDYSANLITDPQWFSKDKLLVLADGVPTVVKIGDGPAKAVSSDDAAAGVTDIALSPDSRRLAYVVDGRAWVAPVIEVDGLEVKLGDPQRVGADVEQVRDIGWSQETRLLIIGDVAGSEDWLWEVSIDNAFEQPLVGTRDSAAVADSLAVRCASPKNTDEVGQPIIVAVGDTIFRVFSDTVEPVTMRIDKQESISAKGYAPFTAP